MLALNLFSLLFFNEIGNGSTGFVLLTKKAGESEERLFPNTLNFLLDAESTIRRDDANMTHFSILTRIGGVRKGVKTEVGKFNPYTTEIE